MSRAPRRMKYNPAFLAEEELRASFVVRQMELAYILESLRENTSGASQHLLVIGPRGSGKSTLVQRVASELRSDPELARIYLPVRFGEESYEVDSAGALWLEALLHLGQQTGERRWQLAHEALRRERDGERLRQLALAELHAYHEYSGQRLVLIVENLQLLLGEHISPDEAWTVRHTLLNDPSIVLLTTATARFAAIEASDQAMYELFRVIMLEPLLATECATIWRHSTGQLVDERQGRALEILTGGNLRLLVALAALGSNAPLHAILENLHGLIDEHTEFFRGNIESLPPAERRVFVALADHWVPATASELSELLRSDVNLVSAQLSRLEQRGVVSATGSPRRKRYQLTERLYNIYYLLRRHGGASERVQVVVDFIAAYYAPDDLVERLVGFAVQSKTMSVKQRELCVRTFLGLYRKVAQTHGEAIRARLPKEFLELPEISTALGPGTAVRQGGVGEILGWLTDPLVAWFTGSQLLAELRALLPRTPTLCASLTGSSTVKNLSPEEIEAIFTELAAIRVDARECCARALAGDERSVGDTVVVLLLSRVWFKDAPLTSEAVERLFAGTLDNRYARLMRLLVARVLGDMATDGFTAEVVRLVDEDNDAVFLPFVAGLMLAFHGDAGSAATVTRGAVLWQRLSPLSEALVEIFYDVRDEEATIVLDPTTSSLFRLLDPEPWTVGFLVLSWLAEAIPHRPEDAVEIIERGLSISRRGFLLRARLAWLKRHSFGAFQESEDIFRVAKELTSATWYEDLVHAIWLVDPQRDVASALAAFTRSWLGFSAARGGGRPKDVSVWLLVGSLCLPGNRAPPLFLSALWCSAAEARRLLENHAHGPDPREKFQIEQAVISLSMRGEAPWVLEWLKAPGRPPVMGILATGVALFLDETLPAPQEVLRIAEDIAFDLRWTRALYEVVHSDEGAPGSTDPKRAHRTRATKQRKSAPGR